MINDSVMNRSDNAGFEASTSRNKGGEEQRKAERRGTLLFSFMPDLVIYIGIYRILANRIGLDYLQEYSALTEFNILH